MLYAWDPKRVVTWPKTQNSFHECAERAEEPFDAPWKGFQAVPMNTESITPAASSCIDYMTASDSSFSQIRMNVPSGISSLAATEAGGLDHAGVGVDPTFFAGPELFGSCRSLRILCHGRVVPVHPRQVIVSDSNTWSA